MHKVDPTVPHPVPLFESTRNESGTPRVAARPIRVARITCLTAIGTLAWNAYGRFREQIERKAVDEALPVELAPWACLRYREIEGVTLERLARRSRSMLVMRALASASLTDTQAPRTELRRALRRLAADRLSGARGSALLPLVTRALAVDQFVERAEDRATAVNVYAAAVLAGDRGVRETRTFLAELSRKLELPPLLVEKIHECAVYAMVSGRGGVPRPQAPEWEVAGGAGGLLTAS